MKCYWCNRKTKRLVKVGYCTFFTRACRRCYPR